MTKSPGSASGKSVSLEGLIALTDEMTSLIRAGVPLESGLMQFAEDHPGGLGELSRRIGERMDGGQSLPEALDAEGNRVPTAFRAIVEAGLRAGKLTVAFDALSGYAWELVELRRQIGIALYYPFIVVMAAYGLFLVVALDVMTRINDLYKPSEVSSHYVAHALAALDRTVMYWGWIPPLIGLILVVWWFRSSDQRLLSGVGRGSLIGWIPGIRRIGENFRTANFAHLMSVLVEQGVPFSEGALLAAEATGDPKLQSAVTSLAEAVARGESLSQPIAGIKSLPPFLGWVLQQGDRQQSLDKSLRIAADVYRRRAKQQTDWLKITFPILAGAGIGGGATLLYALVLFYPVIEMMKNIAAD